MYPILLKVEGFTIRTYGFFIALGVLIAYNYVLHNARKKNIDVNFVANLSFLVLFSGFLGGRLFYVLLNFGYYKENILGILKIWEGGLVFYGGFLVGGSCRDFICFS